MMIKKAVVVQCRLGSTRLKNKALKKIDAKTILEAKYTLKHLGLSGFVFYKIVNIL